MTNPSPESPAAEVAVREARIVPELTFMHGAWHAEIDYLATGDTPEEAAAHFRFGWSETLRDREAHGWYTPEGMKKAEAIFDAKFARELALSRRVHGILGDIKAADGFAAKTTDQYEALCDLIDS